MSQRIILKLFTYSLLNPASNSLEIAKLKLEILLVPQESNSPSDTKSNPVGKSFSSTPWFFMLINKSTTDWKLVFPIQDVLSLTYLAQGVSPTHLWSLQIFANSANELANGPVKNSEKYNAKDLAI